MLKYKAKYKASIIFVVPFSSILLHYLFIIASACCVYVWNDKPHFLQWYTHEPSLRSLLSHQRHNKRATIYIKCYCIKTQMTQTIMSHFYLFLTRRSVKLPVVHVLNATHRWQRIHSPRNKPVCSEGCNFQARWHDLRGVWQSYNRRHLRQAMGPLARQTVA